MSSIDEMRKQGAKFTAGVGAGFLILGFTLAFLGSAWGWVSGAVGFLLLASGAKTYALSSVFEGIPKLLAMVSRHTEPDWDGEILFTDGGRHKVRYRFDSRKRPYFLVNDVCSAIGAESPKKGALRWGGVPLLIHEQHICFSRESIEAYLVPLAIENHEASRLLTKLRNEVFRKLDRALEQIKRPQ